MEMNKNLIIQDAFLNQVRKNHIPATIHLINGFQLRGMIKGFDNFVVVIESDGKQMMIYKHAMSSVTPAQYVNYYTEENEPDGPPPETK